MSSTIVSSQSSVFKQQPPPPPASTMAATQRAQPATATAYEQLCKVVLKHRQRHMWLVSLIASFAALWLAACDITHPSSWVLTLAPLWWCPLAFLGCLPILVLRKQTITTAPAPFPTPFQQLALLRSPAVAGPVVLAYALASVPILAAYIAVAERVSPDPRLGWFFLHGGRDALQLNERRLFLTVLHAALVVVGATSHLAQHRSQVVFPSSASSSAPIPTRLRERLTTALPALATTVLGTNAAVYAAYLFFRTTLLRNLVMRFAPGDWARPALYALLKTNAAISLSLPLRALASSALTLGLWEVAHACFDVYATHPMYISHFAPGNANQCLLSGLRSASPYYQQFALAELAHLSLASESRRKSIFLDVKSGSAAGADGAPGGGMWADIARECLKLVGGELQRAKRGGGEPPKGGVHSTSTPSLSAPHRPHASSSSSSPVKTENVFKPTKKSLFDSFLSPPSAPSAGAKPGPTSGASSAVALASAPGSSTTARVPSVFQTSSASGSAAPPAAATAVQPASKPASSPAAGPATPWAKTVVGLVPRSWGGNDLEVWLGMKGAFEWKVERCLAGKRRVGCAVEALSNLLCASLTEDPYGSAQRDLPKILEAFVLYLFQLEELAAKLAQEVEREPLEDRGRLARVLGDEFGEVEGALKDGLRAVLAEFAPYTDAFAFPPRIAARLQLLVDWG